MTWRILAAAGLIVVLLAGGVLLRGAVADTCAAVGKLLEQAAADRDPETLDSALALWEERLPLLSCAVTHDRLERIGEGIIRAKGCLEAGTEPAFRVQLASVLYLLEDIREYDDINVRTVL